MHQYKALERVKCPSVAVFQQRYLSAQQPIIITDHVSQWDAYKYWNIDYILEKEGKTTVPVYVTQNNWNPLCDTHTVTMSVEEYLLSTDKNNTPDGQHYYLSQLAFTKHFSQLPKDVPPFEYLGKPDPVAVFWLSQKTGSKTNLHFDTAENFLVQISGSKEIILFPPKNYKNYYPDLQIKPRISQVNPLLSTRQEFPKFPFDDGLRCVLNAGEMLYIPIHWWHHVVTKTSSISLSFFQRPKWAYKYSLYEHYTNWHYRLLRLLNNKETG